MKILWDVVPENEDPETWDQMLSGCEKPHVYQSHGWGESQRRSGWKPVRQAARDGNGDVLALTQVLMKHYPGGVRIGWSPGGPAFRSPGAGPEMLTGIAASWVRTMESAGGKIYVRFDNHLLRSPQLALAFSRVFRLPRHFLNSSYSLQFDLSQPLDALKKQMTSHHRRKTRKALAGEIDWKTGNNAEMRNEIMSLFGEMIGIRKDPSLEADRDKIPGICKALGKNVMILTGYHHGRAVSSCLILMFQGRAFYRAAASGKEGRDLSAPYSMIWNLMEQLKDRGIQIFDFGGLGYGNPVFDGINFFKMGFGGEVVEYLGEWEWSNSILLRTAVNFLAGRKKP